jgi:hypothetical protein
MNRKQYFTITCVYSLSLVFSSCGSGQLFGPTKTPTSTITPSPTLTQTPTLTPTQTPPPLSFVGSLIIGVQNDYVKLTENLSIESVENPTNISPNEKFILEIEPGKLNSPGSLILHDLSAKKERKLIEGGGYCIKWAPNSESFSYKTSKESLYIYDITTSSQKLVYQAPSAMYQQEGAPSGTVWAYGELDCGSWVGNKALLFQRYVGEMPYVYSDEAVSANTATLAINDRKITLIDAPQRLYVTDVSDDGTHILMEDGDGFDYITSAFETFDEMDLRRIELGDEVLWQFVSDSHQLYTEGLDANYFLDPETLKTDVSLMFVKKNDGCNFYKEKVWVTHPRNGILACINDDGHVQLVNKVTGQVIILLTRGQLEENFGLYFLDKVNVIDWVP